MKFKRPCSKCGESFLPFGKYNYVCPKCLEGIRQTNNRKLIVYMKENAGTKILKH